MHCFIVSSKDIRKNDCKHNVLHTYGHDPDKRNKNPDNCRTPRVDVVRVCHSPVSEFIFYIFFIFRNFALNVWISACVYCLTSTFWRLLYFFYFKNKPINCNCKKVENGSCTTENVARSPEVAQERSHYPLLCYLGDNQCYHHCFYYHNFTRTVQLSTSLLSRWQSML